jgi:Domain of unknown function (DUF5107)
MTTITTGDHHLLTSNMGPLNPLPRFKGFKAAGAPPAPAKLSTDETEGYYVFGQESLMPYQLCDNYDRSQTEGSLPAIFIENEKLKLMLYPTLGGRLASIYDKEQQRELLFCNPVFQPANLGILNAWFSGGIEWNAIIPGHTPFGCAPIFAGVIETEKGPILRLYEFERRREAAWQIDLFLPPDEAKLWIHPKLINPNTHSIQAYWWTNIAAPLEEGLRILSPADYCIEHVQPDDHLESFPFPHRQGYDGSYPTNYNYAASVFFRRPKQERPWLSAVYEDGHALLHTSTPTALGRKLFVFGGHAGGQRWMDYLSIPGKGNYIELQAGITPTQNQQVTLGPNEKLEWTECIMPLQLGTALTHQPDYHTAQDRVEAMIEEYAPLDELAQFDTWLEAHSDSPIDAVLQHGSAWGMLFERMDDHPLSPGLSFSAPVTCEGLWSELLQDGTFSPETIRQSPTSWAVSERWIALLQESIIQHETTWLHELLLGVAILDKKEYDQAQVHFETSIRLEDTYMARRHLALTCIHRNDIDGAKEEYLRAWTLSDESSPLAVEICGFFQEQGRLSDLEHFLSQLPPTVLAHERVRLACAAVAMDRGELDAVRDILAGTFCDVREGEVLLTDLWFRSHLQDAEQRLGRSLNDEEKAEIMGSNPPPREIDFRMTNDVDH